MAEDRLKTQLLIQVFICAHVDLCVALLAGHDARLLVQQQSPSVATTRWTVIAVAISCTRQSTSSGFSVTCSRPHFLAHSLFLYLCHARGVRSFLLYRLYAWRVGWGEYWEQHANNLNLDTHPNEAVFPTCSFFCCDCD